MAGGKDESVSQPLWSPKNELLFISDRTGWWNIYREVNGKVTLSPAAAAASASAVTAAAAAVPVVSVVAASAVATAAAAAAAEAITVSALH